MADEQDHYGRVTSQHYDEAYAALRDASGDAAFYLALAREADGPVLELGCGTGRILLPIARAGLPCTGLDLSDAMLGAFRAKNPPANLQLVQGEMQGFDLGERRFALITAPFRVFQHLYTVEDQLACLASVRRHLEPGGAFAFDCFWPRLERLAVREEPEKEDARWPDGDDEIVRSASVTRTHRTQMMQVTMNYDRVRNGQRLTRETTTFPMRYFFRYELEHLLARAGFGDVTLYGGFDRSEFGEDSPEMIFVAKV
ncbi:MAG: class I SAM-dependent methyltransferase [Deltaproteobacteria bacterium]|nr:class I SAM-dependent methyltransferase [Deltaproteobacteria bacterium]MBW2446301.1 class I SAM-dependent methyltransferase [Deltaproteobacteria bacterium]